MSGILNMVSRFARGRTTGASAGGRRPAARPGTGRAPHTRGGSTGVEGIARRLIRRAR